VFRRQADLQTIYGNLIRTAIHTVKPDDIATFLGKKLHDNYQDEMGNRYNLRIEGTRVRHSMGMASIKMWDKFGHIPRIETTAKDVSFCKYYREVEQRKDESVMKLAPMKKNYLQSGRAAGCRLIHPQRAAVSKGYGADTPDPRKFPVSASEIVGINFLALFRAFNLAF
jgi:hypothetical protein